MTSQPAHATGTVIARYHAMREAALADAQDRLVIRISASFRIPIALTLVDDRALQAWQAQWLPRSDRAGGWDWGAQRLALRPTLNRFEVAIWSSHVLCGLAIGKPSKGPSHLAIRLLEGNPAGSHPLKGYVTECAVEAAISYARLLGKAQLRLLRPLPDALPAYQRLGFKVEPESLKAPYCFLEL